MPRQCQGDFRRVDAEAIIAHPDRSAAAAFYLDINAPRPGIQRIFHQLLDHGSRPFDDLAGSDLTDEGIGQKLNGQWRPRASTFSHKPEAGVCSGGAWGALSDPRGGGFLP